MSNVKLCTKFELSSFTGFADIVEGSPDYLVVARPRPAPFSEILYLTYTVSGKKKTQYSRHNFDKFRHSFVIFITNNPDTSV